MTSITYKRASSRNELEQIRKLQHQNSINNASEEEKIQEGFVTVEHTITLLEKMNNECAHIIAKDDQKVVGFALIMLASFRNEIEILISMFDKIDKLIPKDKNYVVMGQICVDKNYRKQGIFRGMYDFYKKELSTEYDYLVTEVSVLNKRSMMAHEFVGFKTIETYTSNEIIWNIISWDWK